MGLRQNSLQFAKTKKEISYKRQMTSYILKMEIHILKKDSKSIIYTPPQ